jgi:hypothetical protein
LLTKMIIQVGALGGRAGIWSLKSQLPNLPYCVSIQGVGFVDSEDLRVGTCICPAQFIHDGSQVQKHTLILVAGDRY